MPKRKINKYGLAREIPMPVKREVRKRCGFGCIKCGLMFYEYHHFDPPFHIAKAHNPEGITLLCSNHHDGATRGLISEDTVNELNKVPYCIESSKSNYLLQDLKFPLEVIMGGIVFMSVEGKLFSIDGTEIISVTKGADSEPPFINANFHSDDGHNLKIVENEIVAGVKNWDIETIKNEITIRRKRGNVFLNVAIIAPRRLLIKNIRMINKGNIIHTKSIDRYGEIYLCSTTGAGTNKDFKGQILVGGTLSLNKGELKIEGGCAICPPEKAFDIDQAFLEIRKIAQVTN